MTTFRIRNAITKSTLGVLKANTPAEALDQLAKAGGWDGFAALTREVPFSIGGVLVEELRGDEHSEILRARSGRR